MADNRVGFLFCCLVFLSVLDPRVYNTFPIIFEHVRLVVVTLFVVEMAPLIYNFLGI